MNMPSYRMLPARQFEYLIHALLWSFVLAERWINHVPQAEYPLLYGLYTTFLLLITLLLPAYVHAFVLIPRYLRKAKWLPYVSLLLSMLLLNCLVKGFATVLYLEFSDQLYNPLSELIHWSFREFASLDKFIFGPTAMILWISFAYRFVKDWILNEQIRSRLENEKVSMELAFLKSQIDPHFLFNTLNNIYALALEENADRTADGVARMGALMRYSLHDTQADRILLQKEIDYIEKYIELQKIRTVPGDQVRIQTDIQLEEVSSERIAPMILLPFIENAFKYGLSTIAPSYIGITLKLENSRLRLLVENTVHPIRESSREGIGLRNVRNRLSLMYPGRYSLKCNDSENLYTVALEVDLRHD